MLNFFRVLIILLKGIIPRFASVVSMVWLVSAVSFRSFRPFRLFRSFRSFRWFRFVVSGFSTCHQNQLRSKALQDCRGNSAFKQ